MTANKVGVEGAKTLSEMLKVNTTLISLDLSGDEEERRGKRERKERKE